MTTLTSAPTNAEILEAHETYQAAYEEWMGEIRSIYGDRASEARRQRKGQDKPGTALGDAYDAMVYARSVWRAMVENPARW